MIGVAAPAGIAPRFAIAIVQPSASPGLTDATDALFVSVTSAAAALDSEPSVSAALALFVGSERERAVFVAPNGPPLLPPGLSARSTTTALAPGASVPLSTTPLASVSTSTVSPSARSSSSVVPGGNVLPDRRMSKLSGALPVFVTTLPNSTGVPPTALPTLAPASVTPATRPTVKAAVLVVDQPVSALPSW